MRKWVDFYPEKDLKWFPSSVANIGASLTGNVYYAIQSDHAAYADFIASHQVQYDDGTWAVYNTIQAAVNASTSKRGDVVIVVSPSSTQGKWKENVIVTKTGLKIYAWNYGWETQMRPGDATTKYPMAGNVTVTGFAFLLMARSIELAGFLFDGGGGYGGVYIGDGVNVTGSGQTGSGGNSASCWVHDCVFRGGNEGTYGLVLDGCSANVLIENNIFEQWANSAIYLTPGGGRTVQRPIIRNNEFVASSGTDYGIDFYGAASTVGVLIKGNSFRDDADAFSGAIRIPVGASGIHTIAGNYFACANKWSGNATDFISGNYRANGADGTETVSES